MSTKRVDTTKRFHALRADGTKQCRECGKDLPKGRQRWCSDACGEAYNLRVSPALARQKVHLRDKGICRDCRVDCDRLERWLRELPTQPNKYAATTSKTSRFDDGAFGRWLGRHRARAKTLLGKLWGVSLRGRKTLWDNDHDRALAEGGSNTLENMVTRCRKCHHRKTVEQAARRARIPQKVRDRGF